MVEASSLGKGEGRGESKASVNDQDGKISGGKDERHAEREKSTRNRRKEREKRDRVERSISEGERRCACPAVLLSLKLHFVLSFHCMELSVP